MDLSCGHHCDYIVKRARERLYALRVLKKTGLPAQDITQVYFSLVRSVLKYAAPVWDGLLSYLSDLVESAQREALRIIVGAGLQTLSERRNQTCMCTLYPGSICITFSVSGKPAFRTNKRQHWI